MLFWFMSLTTVEVDAACMRYWRWVLFLDEALDIWNTINVALALRYDDCERLLADGILLIEG